MNRSILALFAVALLSAAGLLALQPVAAQPSWPCTEETLGTYTKALAYSPPGLHTAKGSWDVYEFHCGGSPPRWIQATYPVASFNTQDKPASFLPTHEYDEDGSSIYVAIGTPDLGNPLSGNTRAVWSEAGTEKVRQIIEDYSSASEICQAIYDIADNVSPANVYYLNGRWHLIMYGYLSDLPLDARMANIWRNVPECGRWYVAP